MVLLRFAPSPTGPLHLGGLRMALYNHLFAKKHAGKWILRIEDTDMSRFVPGSVDGIRKSLEWAGLNYDYGPGQEGPHGPYFQSERLDLYKSYAGKLIESGHAYRCFCSPDTLSETKEKLARAGSSASYDRRCLHLTEEEVARKTRAGEKFVVRFNNAVRPNRQPASDLIFTKLKDAHASLATDPILLKSDQFPTYHLASIADDHEMGITHVMRGEEWLPSLPLHLDLYASLNIPPPIFAHLPILLNPDGSKMSKRHGDVQVIDFIKRGWEPEAVLNWLLLSGWGGHHSVPADPNASQKTPVPDSTQVLTMQEMIEKFDITSLTHRNTILEAAKLEYINKHHIMRQTRERGPDPKTGEITNIGLRSLAEKVHGQVKESFPTSQYTTIDMIEKAIMILEGRLTNIYDIPLHAPYLFIDPDLTSDKSKKLRSKIPDAEYDAVLDEVHSKLEEVPEAWEDTDLLGLLHASRDKLGMSTKNFMRVLRWKLTGMKDGPGLADVMDVLGRERTLARLKK
ncbi:hypothetical protein CVT24_008876 [Panaeolus cyanescens]|uniref:Glutamate--tRNA ligase, mitochondrial n=1 Tax=Panaeolus cyanescens TaxID=181874 RepID=A0A409VAW3_9AGAR|nr:hypothetical protein CVT24_008876 [Panaeolus cyanescens]